MSYLALQLQAYQLTTATIIYERPDYPTFLQTYLWQEYDLAPDYPVLKKFLDFWRRTLDGRIHSVELASRGLIKPPQFRAEGPIFHVGPWPRLRYKPGPKPIIRRTH